MVKTDTIVVELVQEKDFSPAELKELTLHWLDNQRMNQSTPLRGKPAFNIGDFVKGKPWNSSLPRYGIVEAIKPHYSSCDYHFVVAYLSANYDVNRHEYTTNQLELIEV